MKHVLRQTSHRPWPLMARHWMMAQRWHDLLFAHWRLPVELIRPLIPAPLRIDTFDGQAWLGVVPFWMSGIRLRGTPALPGLSRFPEINVRTYVTDGERHGVWFFSLDAPGRIAVAAARRFYFLPYFRAAMRLSRDGEAIRYRSRRLTTNAMDVAFEGSYRPTGPVRLAAPGTLAHWFTERYCLYSADNRGGIYRGEIHHVPWPLQPAALEVTRNTMTAPLGIVLPATPPQLHFSRELLVAIWKIDRLATQSPP